MNRFARWIVKHRVAVVIICLLMLIPSVLGMNATKVKYDLLRWQFAIAFALAAIMAKGFGWIGF